MRSPHRRRRGFTSDAHDSPDAVRAKHDALAAGGVAITRPMKNEPAITSFRCADPNGYSIEIYWLPG